MLSVFCLKNTLTQMGIITRKCEREFFRVVPFLKWDNGFLDWGAGPDGREGLR